MYGPLKPSNVSVYSKLVSVVDKAVHVQFRFGHGFPDPLVGGAGTAAAGTVMFPFFFDGVSLVGPDDADVCWASTTLLPPLVHWICWV
jgi:hypothetical protein